MYSGHYPHRPHAVPRRGPPAHRGLLGIVGGVIGLTTTTLGGATRMVRTVVEGTLWQGPDCACPACHHAYPRCGPCACSVHHNLCACTPSYYIYHC